MHDCCNTPNASYIAMVLMTIASYIPITQLQLSLCVHKIELKGSHLNNVNTKSISFVTYNISIPSYSPNKHRVTSGDQSIYFIAFIYSSHKLHSCMHACTCRIYYTQLANWYLYTSQLDMMDSYSYRCIYVHSKV